MAIAFDTALDGGVANTSTITVGYTATGANLALIVCLAYNPAASISGVTWNGSPLTLASTQVNIAGTNTVALWYLLGASSGTHNVVVANAGGTNIYTKIASYAGVSASGNPDATVTNAVDLGNAPVVTSITTVADNDWLIASHNSPSSGQPTTDGNLRVDGASGLGDLLDKGPITPAGATSLSTTIGSFGPSYSNCLVIIALKPDIASAIPVGPAMAAPLVTYSLEYSIPC